MAQIFHNVNMGLLTTIGVGGIAKNFIIMESLRDLRFIRKQPPIIGNGSNIIVAQNLDLVIQLGQQFKSTQKLSRLAAKMQKKGQSGLEFTAGIPATLGGAIKMNAGGKFGSMEDIVREVIVFREGRVEWMEPQFGYRSSNIQGIILDARLELKPDDPDAIAKRTKDIIKSKAGSQPLGSRSAGCIFKNPPGGSAGRIIDQCGLKGRGYGGVRVSPVHANFIVAEPNADVKDVIRTILMVRNVVYEMRGIHLELEVEIWPPQKNL